MQEQKGVSSSKGSPDLKVNLWELKKKKWASSFILEGVCALAIGALENTSIQEKP